MNRKDVLILLAPSIVWIMVAFGALENGLKIQAYHNADKHRKNQEAFDQFAENVKSGKWPLTQEQMLTGMRVSRDKANAEYNISASEGRLMGGVFVL